MSKNMSRDHADFLVDMMCDKITVALKRIRDDDFGCASCGVPNGKQHLKKCAVWPLVEFREAYWDAEGRPLHIEGEVH